jgi:hypothetical protein
MLESTIDTIWCAWSELNRIRARDGAPEGVCPDYFDGLVEEMRGLLPEEYQKPWHPKYVRNNQND